MQEKKITKGIILLRQWMSDNNYTQEAFAEKLGTTQAVVGKWANGHKCPRISSALLIEKATKGYVNIASWAQPQSGSTMHLLQKKKNKKKKSDEKSTDTIITKNVKSTNLRK